MEVTILLPNYNHSLYLRQRIDSVLNQRFEDYELIILDDYSTDNSRDIIESYRHHPKVSKIVYNEKNSGSTFNQWEKGIKMANGKYIWIAESDDFSDPLFLESAIAAFKKHPEAGLVFSESNIVDQENNILSDHYSYPQDFKEQFSRDFFIDGQTFCEKYLFFFCAIVNASAVVFEKKLFEKVGEGYKAYKVCGDWRAWVDICFNTNVIFLKKNLNYFRFHTNNVRTNKASLMNTEAIDNYIYFLKKSDSPVAKKELKTSILKHWCFEFSRDISNRKLKKSIKIIPKITLSYPSFFIGLLMYKLMKRA